MAAVILTGLILSACAGPSTSSRVTTKLVIVAVDGATWNIMSPLMSRGQLPRLASLVNGGSAGRLRAPEPLLTAPLWTSVATGRPPGRHGIVADVARTPGRYVLRPVTADLRRTPALWTIAASRDVAVGVVGWPATFPAEAVKGYMVSEEWDPALAASPRGAYPESAVGDGDEQQLVIPERLLPVTALGEDLRTWFQRDLQDLSRGLALYRVHQPAIALFRFRSIDGASHRYWPYMERRFLEVMADRGEPVDPVMADARSRAIPGAYEMFDAWVGMLMEGLPEDATLLIVSDHGFRGIKPGEDLRVDLNLLLRKLGQQTLTAAGDPDWTRTSAFALEDGGSERRGLFLNIKGREVEGSLDPASANALVVDLAASLEAIVGADGTKLFRVESGDAIGADSETPGAPDLWVTQEPGFSSDTRIRIAGETMPLDDIASPAGVFGVHDPAGIVLGFGRGIASGQAGWEGDLLDVLPTVLRLAGFPQSSDLPGKVMEKLLAEPLPADEAVTSYDALAASPAEVMMPAPMATAAIDALRRTSHLF